MNTEAIHASADTQAGLLRAACRMIRKYPGATDAEVGELIGAQGDLDTVREAREAMAASGGRHG